MNKRTLSTTVAALALITAGCGGDDDDTPAPSDTVDTMDETMTDTMDATMTDDMMTDDMTGG